MARPRPTRWLAAMGKVFLGLGVLALALVVTVFAVAAILVGTVAALGLACLAALLPLGLLLFLALWGWWVDRVWMRVEVEEPEHSLALTFPVPLSLLRLAGRAQVVFNGRKMPVKLSDLPWRDMRTVLREEALTVDVVDPMGRARMHLTIGPRKQVVGHHGSLTIIWNSRKR